MSAHDDMITYIIDELKSYKRYKALLKQSELECVCIPAQVLKETPRSTTNKFSSMTENSAIYGTVEQRTLIDKIAMIDNWLEYLPPPESHVLEYLYVQNMISSTNVYRQVNDGWFDKYDTYYSDSYWKGVRKKALSKLVNLMCTVVKK